MTSSRRFDMSRLAPLITATCLLAALVFSVVPAAPARAASPGVTVTTLDDGGPGSLRDAITQANAKKGADTITFSISGVIILASTLPAISDASGLTIDGTGQSITISGNHAVRVMEVSVGAALTLRHVFVVDGHAGYPIQGCDSCGGGIYSAGGLTVSNSTFSGNSTDDGKGGGIYNDGRFCYPNCGLTISNSTFSGNSAAYGGGIYDHGADLGVGGNLTVSTVSNSIFSDNLGGGIVSEERATEEPAMIVSNSTFSGNGAAHGGGGISNLIGVMTVSNSIFSGNSGTDGGGGILNGGVLTVSDSTFSGNSATYWGGGGILNGGYLTVSNSTFSGNGATCGGGGGIANLGELTISNSTLLGNSADSCSGRGGGIWSFSGNANIGNTIVADSTRGGDCSLYDFNGIGPNLATDSTCVGQHGNLGAPFIPTTSAALSLGPLVDNGGSTLTFALLPGSVAIDSGDDTICAAAPVNNLDQRGMTRPQFVHCDIGAYEFAPPLAELNMYIANFLSNKPNLVNSLQQQASAIANATDAQAKPDALQSFINHVEAITAPPTNNPLTADQAAKLIALASRL